MSSRPKAKKPNKRALERIASISGVSVAEVERLWQRQHASQKHQHKRTGGL